MPNGNCLAVFDKEEQLDEWWSEFQRSQGRSAKPLSSAPILNPHLAKKSKAARQRENGDYLHPWSEEHDMPEYDLE